MMKQIKEGRNLINRYRSQLGIKLFVSYLLVILVGSLVIGVSSKFIYPRTFERHMVHGGGQYGMGWMMGDPGRSGVIGDMTSDLYLGYQASFNEALIWALLTAAVVAVIVSLVLSRNIVAPVRAMMVASKRIAEGKYSDRIKVAGSDEISELADHFNQMAEKLEQVETMRRRLIGDVAHELRTPLAVIQGSMEGLVDGKLPAKMETFEQVRAETLRLSRLVDDLQELSRVEAGAYELKPGEINFSTVLASVVKRLKQEILLSKVELRTELEDEPILVLADEGRLLQILTNLLDNALQHTPEKGTVTISAKQSGHTATISVKDTGLGIPAEHMPFIFDRFYRADKARSRKKGGSGVGLTIAKHLVEAQGGRIWAESAGENKGSEFTFTLPLGSKR